MVMGSGALCSLLGSFVALLTSQTFGVGQGLGAPAPATAMALEMEPELRPEYGPYAYDFFGYAVAADGETVLIGAPGDNGGTLNAGAVYVYRRGRGGPEGLEATAKVQAEEPAALGFFGASLAFAGGLVVVGEPGEYFYGGLHGRVHLLRDPGGEGAGLVAEATLDCPQASDRDTFGEAVATDGVRVVVGASTLAHGDDTLARAFVFVRDGDGWDLEATLAPSLEDLCPFEGGHFGDPCGGVYHLFGGSVAIAGDTLWVGDVRRDVVYRFVRGDTGWVEAERHPGREIDFAAPGIAVIDGVLLREASGVWAPEPAARAAPDEVVAVVGDRLVGSETSDPVMGAHGERHFDWGIYRDVGDRWEREASLFEENSIQFRQYDRRPTAFTGDLAVFGRSAEGSLAVHAGLARVFGRSAGDWSEAEPLDPAAANASLDGCGCGVDGAAGRGDAPASWLALLGVVWAWGARRRSYSRSVHDRSDSRIARRRRTGRRGVSAVAVVAGCALFTISPSLVSKIFPKYSIERVAAACSFSGPAGGYPLESHWDSPELEGIPTDGALVFWIGGGEIDAGFDFAELDSRLQIVVFHQGEEVPGEVTVFPESIHHRPQYFEWAIEALVLWRPDGGFAPDSTYEVTLHWLDSEGLPYFSVTREATTGSSPMGPLTAPAVHSAVVSAEIIASEREVCCETASWDSCGSYLYCTDLVEHWQPALTVYGEPTLPPAEARMTRAVFARPTPEGPEILPITDFGGRHGRYYELTGRVFVDDAAPEYCVQMGTQSLLTGEVVFSEEFCVAHGDVEAPATTERDPAAQVGAWSCAGPLYDVESGEIIPGFMDNTEVEAGCRLASRPPASGALLGLVVLGALGARRRRRR